MESWAIVVGGRDRLGLIAGAGQDGGRWFRMVQDEVEDGRRWLRMFQG